MRGKTVVIRRKRQASAKQLWGAGARQDGGYMFLRIDVGGSALEKQFLLCSGGRELGGGGTARLYRRLSCVDEYR